MAGTRNYYIWWDFSKPFGHLLYPDHFAAVAEVFPVVHDPICQAVFNDPWKTLKQSLHGHYITPVSKTRSYNFHYRGNPPSKVDAWTSSQKEDVYCFSCWFKICNIDCFHLGTLTFHPHCQSPGKSLFFSQCSNPKVLWFLLSAHSLMSSQLQSYIFFRKNKL